MATLDQIAQLGHDEKQAAREYMTEVSPGWTRIGATEQHVRMAFLQGIQWAYDQAKAKRARRWTELEAAIAADIGPLED